MRTISYLIMMMMMINYFAFFGLGPDALTAHSHINEEQSRITKCLLGTNLEGLLAIEKNMITSYENCITAT